MRVFVAGGTGALGRALIPALVAAGHDVVGSTRAKARAGIIEAAGATAVVCDALDADATSKAVVHAAPEVVVHQLTALPRSFADLGRGTAATDRLRRDGTENLIAAAREAGARRLIAESVASVYAPDSAGTATEEDLTWADAPSTYSETIRAALDLEQMTTHTPGLEGVALRYGALYGPGTYYASDGDFIAQIRKRRIPIVGSGAGVTSFLHVEDAAEATLAAMSTDSPTGIYNIADEDPVAFRDLLPTLAMMFDAPKPLRLPTWLARPLAGAVGVAVMTAQRGANSDKAAREIGWRPRHRSWRDGLVDGR